MLPFALLASACDCGRAVGESGHGSRSVLFGGVIGKPDESAAESGGPNTRPYVPPKVPLGLNLSAVSYYASAIPFVDAMKMADPFASTNSPLAHNVENEWDTHVADKVARDADGFPLEAPSMVKGHSAPQVLRASVVSALYSGRYVLLYDGDGDFDFPASPVKVASRAPGRIELDVQAQHDRSIFVSIVRSNRANHVRNVRLLLPGYEATYQRNVFHPTFIARMRGVGIVRFMDWAGTNNSKVARWSDRTRPSMPQGTPRGVALEYMIELANQLDADAWFCVPHMADDRYIEEMAKLIKARLDPKHRAWIEYSNELWNGIFEQSQWVKQRGCKEGLNELDPYAGSCDDDGNRYWAGIKWQARRSGQIFQIFDRTFGSQAARVVHVLAGQAQNEHLNDKLLESFERAAINKARTQADVLAVAPYFGGSLAAEIDDEGKAVSVTVDEIVQRLEQRIGPEVHDSTAKNQKIAARHGVHLVAYEGGQHLVAYGDAAKNELFVRKLIAANREPRMRALYDKALDTWYAQSDNGLMILFNYIEAPTKFGAWGLLESQEQRAEAAPKYQAFFDRLQRFNSRAAREPASAAPATSAAATEPESVADPSTAPSAASPPQPPAAPAPPSVRAPNTQLDAKSPHGALALPGPKPPTAPAPPAAPQPPASPKTPE